MRLSLRAKIVGPFVLLVALVGTIGTAAVTAQVTSESVAEFNGSLLRAGLLANDHLALVEAARLSTLRAAAGTIGVSEATAARDTAALLRLLTPVVANAAVPSLRLHILDRQGKALILVGPDGAAANPAGDNPYLAEPAVAAVLAGRSDAQGDKYVFIATEPTGATLYWTGPVHAQTGQVVGVVLVGEPLAAIAAGIRASGSADLIFYGPAGSVLLSSLSTTDALSPAVRSLVRSDQPVRFSQASDGQPFTLLVSNWAMRGVRLGYVAVALNGSSLQASLGQIRLLLVLLFAAAAFITLLIGLALAGAITRPVHRLVGAMRAVAAGDLTQRAPTGPSDEIGYLGQVFNLMTKGLQEKTDALEDTYFAAIEALARAIDARDPYTLGHSARVATISLEIADALGYPQEKREALRRAALLHDIGKIGIEDQILRKVGALNYAEARRMREHPTIGHQMLKDVVFLHPSLSGVRHHHERWDARGYPDGLAADRIPLQVRILSVADVLDALTSDRPYRPAISFDEAVALISREAHRQFDPAVVSAFRSRAEAIVTSLRRLRREPPIATDLALEKAS
jgi:putative nucleotidyltransferase with HDIG domain